VHIIRKRWQHLVQWWHHGHHRWHHHGLLIHRHRNVLDGGPDRIWQHLHVTFVLDQVDRRGFLVTTSLNVIGSRSIDVIGKSVEWNRFILDLSSCLGKFDLISVVMAAFELCCIGKLLDLQTHKRHENTDFHFVCFA